MPADDPSTRRDASRDGATPALAMVNLAVFSVFMLVAGLGTLVPRLVKDRLPEQFRPLWRALLPSEDEEWQRVPDALAVASQWGIGVAEVAIGVVAGLALIMPERRLALARAGLCGGTALFGMFMIVLFYLHEASLPKWNQYPALLVWFAATWLLLTGGTGRPAAAAGRDG